MREIVAFDDLLAVQPVRSALYVSSGADTKALIFTDPAFLRERGAAALGEIGVYVYIDANMALDDASAKLGFRDARTTIETGAEEMTLPSLSVAEATSAWVPAVGTFQVKV